MSDIIRASKIIASGMLVAGGGIAFAIAGGITNLGGGPIQMVAIVILIVGGVLLIPAWLGTSGRSSAARADDVETQIHGEVERMRSLARTAKRIQSEADGN